MKRVTTEDAQLRCEHSLRPGAPALLLLNPLGTSLEVWDEAFPALAERYEIVRYDKREDRAHDGATRPRRARGARRMRHRARAPVRPVDRRDDGHADRDAVAGSRAQGRPVQHVT